MIHQLQLPLLCYPFQIEPPFLDFREDISGDDVVLLVVVDKKDIDAVLVKLRHLPLPERSLQFRTSIEPGSSLPGQVLQKRPA